MVEVLIGAVLGFAGSVVGSIAINRWQMRQDARYRLYTDLMPTLRDEHELVSRREAAAATARRVGIVLRRDERRALDAIEPRLRDLRAGGPDPSTLLSRYSDAVRALDRLLEKRLR